jgi:hypothetical protein
MRTPTQHRPPTLSHDGETWTLQVGPDVVRLRDGAGLRQLATLAERPGVAHRADALAAAGRHGGACALAADDLDDDLRDRLRELGEELEEAEAIFDTGRAAVIREGLRRVAEEAARRHGPTVHLPAPATAPEDVSRTLHAALRRIGTHAPELEDELRRAISTGTTCTYRPASGLRLSIGSPATPRR